MKRILIIENNADLLSSYTEILTKTGFEVLIALYGDTGINEAITKVPDLILCNTLIPHIDGFGVLSVLSKNSATAHIPFIFVSHTAKSTNFRKGMDMGADDFITRPFRDNQLIKAVEARLIKSKSRVDASQSLPESSDNKFLIEKGIDHLQETILQSNFRRIKKKQVLYSEGDYNQGIYFLKEGCIKTFKVNSDGRQLITNIYNSNSLIGLGYLMIDGPLGESAEAVEYSSVYFIAKKTILDLLKADTNLNHYIIRMLSSDLAHKNDRLVELAYESVRKRLSKIIIQLNKNSFPINEVEISRDELAGLAGTATETVSRILTDFKQLGLIKRNGNFINITNYEGLSRSSNILFILPFFEVFCEFVNHILR
ncbi:Fumarate and nitrate reduction regulatory protein [compost metagenome]